MPSLCWESSLDPYTVFLKSTWDEAVKRNPTVKVADIEKFCWTTWDACGANKDCARWYVSDSMQECNLNPLDNADYYGWVGAHWYVIVIVLQRHGMKEPRVGWKSWIRKHPWHVNYILAKHFNCFYKTMGIDIALRRWEYGDGWKTMPVIKKKTDLYIKQIHFLREELDGISAKIQPLQNNSLIADVNHSYFVPNILVTSLNVVDNPVCIK